MNDELIEVFDDAGVSLGRASRAEAHARGLWHKTVHVWVIIPDGEGSGALLFQRRSATKDVAPNLVDVSVGGHIDIGEATLSAACRELREELGLVAAPEHLRPLGVRQTAGIYGGALDREIQTLYGIEERRPLDAYRVQATEIAALAPVPVGDGLALFSGVAQAVEIRVRRVLPDGRTIPAVERITLSDFIPSVDRYFYRAFVMARRWLRGEDHLLI